MAIPTYDFNQAVNFTKFEKALTEREFPSAADALIRGCDTLLVACSADSELGSLYTKAIQDTKSLIGNIEKHAKKSGDDVSKDLRDVFNAINSPSNSFSLAQSMENFIDANENRVGNAEDKELQRKLAGKPLNAFNESISKLQEKYPTVVEELAPSIPWYQAILDAFKSFGNAITKLFTSDPYQPLTDEDRHARDAAIQKSLVDSGLAYEETQPIKTSPKKPEMTLEALEKDAVIKQSMAEADLIDQADVDVAVKALAQAKSGVQPDTEIPPPGKFAGAEIAKQQENKGVVKGIN